MASITSLSAITITGLVATSGIVGEVPLNWSYTTPPGQGCLSYMIPVSFEIYRGTTTSFAAGTTVLRATAPTAAYSDKGVDTTTRYYWIVAVDPNGNRSAPVGPVSATAAPAAATTADLAAAVVDYTAKIAHEESERESADGATATALTTVSATATDAQTKANLGTATGKFGITAVASPSGFSATGQFVGSVTVGGTQRQAGLAFDVSGSTARARLIGNQVVLQDNSGNIFPLFTSDGKVLTARMDKIIAGMLDVGTVNATNIIANNIIQTGQVQSNQITAINIGSNGDAAIGTTTSDLTIGDTSISVAGGPIIYCQFLAYQRLPGADSSNFGDYVLSMYVTPPGSSRMGPIASINPSYDDSYSQAPIFAGAYAATVDGTYRFTVTITAHPTGGLTSFAMTAIKMLTVQYKR